MTETTPAVPAGWYADPAGSGRHRWWDGTTWTDVFYETGPTAAPPLAAPAGTNPTTPWIWAIVATVVVIAIPRVFADPSPLRSDWTIADLVVIVVAILGFAALVVLAYLDHRELVRRGIPKPFPWGWMFFAALTPLVYLIGRSVVVQRRTGTGALPGMLGVAAVVVSGALAGVLSAVVASF